MKITIDTQCSEKSINLDGKIWYLDYLDNKEEVRSLKNFFKSLIKGLRIKKIDGEGQQ